MNAREIQSLGDYHWQQMLPILRSKNQQKIDLHLFCLNYMRKKRPEFQWTAQQGVMHGWLTVKADGEYILKP